MSIIASLLSIILHPFTNLTWTSQGISGNTPKLFSWYQWRGFFSKLVTSKVLFHPKDLFAEKVNSQGQTLIYNPFDMNPKRLYNRKVKRLWSNIPIFGVSSLILTHWHHCWNWDCRENTQNGDPLQIRLQTPLQSLHMCLHRVCSLAHV